MRILKSSLLFILFTLPISGQIVNNDALCNSCNTTEKERYYKQVYKDTPSMLAHWNATDWSYISLSYFKEKGDFRNPQMYSKATGLKLKTASIVKLDTSDWTFYGAFEYHNKRVDSVMNNLSYYIYSNESPYYIFMKKAGDWNLQNYQFDVTATKRLFHKKLAIGLHVKYKVLMAFRTNDTRNNQTNLGIESTLSGTYSVSQKNDWSAGVKYCSNKTKSKLSNSYQHASQGLEYNRYLNAGLGTYIKNIPAGFLTEVAEIGALLQWTKNTTTNSYSVYVDSGFGTEKWIDETIVSVLKNQCISQYNYSKQTLHGTFIHRFNQGYLRSNLNGFFTVGKGKLWKEKQRRYVQNYNTNRLRLNVSNELVFKDKFIHTIGLFLGYDAMDNFDKNYNYKLQNSSYEYGPNISFLTKIKGRSLFTSGAVIFHQNSDYLHRPNAAKNNLFTSWIANPRSDYLRTNFVKYQGNVRYATDFEGQPIVFNLALAYDRPNNKQRVQLVQNNTDFWALNASIRLYF